MNKHLVHSVFEARAVSDGERIAVEQGARRITYHSLNCLANAIALRLREQGLAREDLVALPIEAGIEYIAGMLGALKAGGAILPLDPALPAPRLAAILAQTQPRFVLCARAEQAEACRAAGHSTFYELAFGYDPAMLQVDGRAVNEVENPALIGEGDDTAYLMFTSGSTGVPKGVVGRQRGLSHFIHWELGEFAVGPTDKVSLFAPTTFDVSLRDIFVPLLAGGTLCIPEEGIKRDAVQLKQWLERSGVTLSHMVPSLFRPLMKELASDPAGLPSQRLILLAGEPLYGGDVQQWMDLVGTRIQLVNLYGPTETTLAKLFNRITERPEQANKIMPLGKPINNTAVLILQNNQLCPIGTIGEIHILTPFMSKGYYKDPELTQRAFIANPLEGQEGLIYKTGDLGRYLPDRSIEYVGRLDHQVKVNGNRVELSEIEIALRQHPRVDNAVVIAHRNEAHETLLAAYYTLSAPVTAEELRGYLAERLPAYMLPVFFTELDELPQNLNGKVDRKALPKPEELVYARSGFEAPVGELEERIAALWSEHLGLRRISATSPFFLLGGHSLMATRLVAALCRAFDVELSLQDFFTHATVRQLAELLARGDRQHYRPIPKLGVQGEAPLSPAQRRLWVLDQMKGDAAAYNIPAVFLMEGGIDAHALEQALLQMAERHEILRTLFPAVDGQPHQVVLERPVPFFESRDLGDEPRALDVARQLALLEAKRPFDLAEGPLWRVTLLRLAPEHGLERHVFVFNMHHIIGDVWSIGIFVRELNELYRTHLEGRKHSLPQLTIQYRDYAAWQNRERLDLSGQQSYWHQKLGGLSRLELPTDRPRGQVRSYRGAMAQFQVPAELCARIQAVAAERGVSFFGVLLALVKLLLHRQSGQDDINVGTPVAGRNHPDLEGQIGFFLNMLVLRDRLHGHLSFAQVLSAVAQTLNEALSSQDYPFDLLVDEVEKVRDPSRSPLFDVMVDYQEKISFQIEGLRITELENLTATGKYELSFQFVGSPTALELDLAYDADLFEPNRVRQLFGHFLSLAEAALAQPQRPIGALQMLTAAERAQHPDFHLPQDLSYPRRTVLERFDQAVETATVPALVHEGRGVAYGELAARVEAVAAWLVAQQLAPGSLIGVLTQRNPEAIAALLGILRAGHTYVPLDPGQPDQRLHQLSADLALILCDDANFERAQTLGACQNTAALPTTQARVSRDLALAEAPAYMIYTSGSTGTPKGVPIQHQSLAGYMDWAESFYFAGRGRGRHMALFTSPGFDLTLTMTLLPLLRGDTLYLYDDPAVETVLAQIFAANSPVRVVKLTPTHLRLLSHLSLEATAVEQVIVGGEALSADLVCRLRLLNPRIAIYNEYGPTEATIGCICAEILETEVTIGTPAEHTQALILDAYGNPCATGLRGEICLAGPNLSPGYYRRPGMTAARFTPHPFADGLRLYHTGDLGYRLADGGFQYLGRMDDQVKIRGFRIEPAEVEAALISHDQVGEAVVLPVKASDGENVLAAWFTGEVGLAELRAHLCERLPAPLIPSHFVPVAELPLTLNGKLDRKRLPDPFATALRPEQGSERSDDPVEQAIGKIWCDVLQLSHVGLDDNFFELGGHSLMGVRLITRLQRQFGIALTLTDLFRAPTIRTLAREAAYRAHDSYRQIPAQPPRAHYELAPAQKRLWLADQMLPGQTTYNIPGGLLFEGAFDEGAMVAAFQQLVARHESLRTTIRVIDGQPGQHIGDASAFRVELIDLRDQPFERTALIACLDQLGRHVFDLERGPLLRVQLLRLAPGPDGPRHAVLLNVHHICSDAWSIEVLVGELLQSYSAGLRGENQAQPPLRIQYRDYAVWQNRLLREGAFEQDRQFWHDQLRALEPLRLPTDFPRTAQRSQRGDRAQLPLGETGAMRLAELARRFEASPFMVLLGLARVLLYRITRQEAIAVGTSTAGRYHPDLEPQIGFYMNLIALPDRLLGEETLAATLTRAREQAVVAFEHQDYPFDQLVAELGAGRDRDRAPLFDVLVYLDNTRQAASAQRFGQLEGVTVSSLDHTLAGAKYDLSFAFEDAGNALTGKIEFNADLFRAETVRGWAEQFCLLLELAVENDRLTLDQICERLQSEGERTEAAHWSNAALAEIGEDF